MIHDISSLIPITYYNSLLLSCSSKALRRVYLVSLFVFPQCYVRFYIPATLQNILLLLQHLLQGNCFQLPPDNPIRSEMAVMYSVKKHSWWQRGNCWIHPFNHVSFLMFPNISPRTVVWNTLTLIRIKRVVGREWWSSTFLSIFTVPVEKTRRLEVCPWTDTCSWQVTSRLQYSWHIGQF